MILLTNNPAERELRSWLINAIGEEDQRVFVEWVWDNHRASGVSYVDALAAIVQETGERGPGFLHNLLDFAKKPKEVRELEQQIIAWANPKIRAAAAVVAGHRGDQDVARDQQQTFADEFVSFLRRLFPHTHRAAMHGAVVSTLKNENGAFTLDVAGLVKSLRMDDPLASNAKASWM